MKRLVLASILSLCALFMRGQTIDFAAPVSFAYDGETLEFVLEDFASRYEVKISYSRQLIPMEHKVHAEAVNMELSDALEVLFDGTAVIYGFIGNQLVLSIDPDLREQLLHPDLLGEPIASTELDYLPRETYEFSPIYQNYSGFATDVEAIETDVFSREYIAFEGDRLMRQAERDASAFRAQVTLVPPLRAISLPYSHAPVNISLNILVGVNDNIEGFELGGLTNVVKGTMTGVQIAGLANGVAHSSRGYQMAGITNVVKEPSTGLQFAGVANVASTGGELIQVGGLTNVAGSHIMAQVSGIANHARTVDGIQISGLFNFAGTTKAQVGLFNFADTSTVSIGLLSFIKSGYQSVEIGGEEVMHFNVNARLGQRGFYNILHASSTYDFSSWAFGYGLGTAVRTGSKGNHVQLELMSRHVSENESWTDQLNLLNQFNILWDIRLGSRASLAFGPTINVMVSKRFNPETETYGSELPPYTIFDETFRGNGNGPINVKGWLGFHVGVRYSAY